MYKKKSLFVTFEGIEGSGKSYQSKILYKKLKNNKISSTLTREPGGTKGAEIIRKIILKDYFQHNPKEQFSKETDTLLYLAARNEHIRNKLKPALKKKQTVICDRFIDSTTAYQVDGKGVNKNLVDSVHMHILKDVIPDLTFILTVNINKAIKRLKKRKKKNRYDKFSNKFYKKVQQAFIKIGKKNKKRYIILDNSSDSKEVENTIFNIVFKKLSK